MSKYSTDSELTRDVCNKLGFIYDVQFVSTRKVKDKVFINFTCGKPDEIWALYNAIKKADKSLNYFPSKGLIDALERC